MLAVGAAAALFGAVQSWINGREIAELRGELASTSAVVREHVNAAGLHR